MYRKIDSVFLGIGCVFLEVGCVCLEILCSFSRMGTVPECTLKVVVFLDIALVEFSWEIGGFPQMLFSLKLVVFSSGDVCLEMCGVFLQFKGSN